MAGFQKGQSGNPAGKRKGTRNKVAVLADELTSALASAILQSSLNGQEGLHDCCLIKILSRHNPDLGQRIMAECTRIVKRDIAKTNKIIEKISNTEKGLKKCTTTRQNCATG